MNRTIVRISAAALAVLVVSPGLAHDAGEEPQSEAPGGHGMQMGQGMMQGGMGEQQGMQGSMGQHQGMMGGGMGQMMQMMSHCAGMMEEMHGESGEHDMGGQEGSGGAHGMPMMPGTMEDPQAAGGDDSATAEALARAFVSGRAGVEAGQVEIVGVRAEDGSYLVEYRHGSSTGTVLVDAESGAVSEVER